MYHIVDNMIPAEIIQEIGSWCYPKTRQALFGVCRNYWRSRYNVKILPETHPFILRGHYHYSGSNLTLSQHIDHKFRISAPNLTSLHIVGNFGKSYHLPNLSKLEYLEIKICWYSRDWSPKHLVDQLEQMNPGAQIQLDIHADNSLLTDRDAHQAKLQQFIHLMSIHPKFNWNGPYNIGMDGRSMIIDTVKLTDFTIYKRQRMLVPTHLKCNRYLVQVSTNTPTNIDLRQLSTRITNDRIRNVFLELAKEDWPDYIWELMDIFSQRSYNIWIEPYLSGMLLGMPAAWLFFWNDSSFRLEMSELLLTKLEPIAQQVLSVINNQD